MSRRAWLFAFLFGAAIWLCIAGYVLWSRSSTDAADAQQFTSLQCAMTVTNCDDQTAPDRVPATVAFIAAGSALLAATIIGATTRD